MLADRIEPFESQTNAASAAQYWWCKQCDRWVHETSVLRLEQPHPTCFQCRQQVKPLHLKSCRVQFNVGHDDYRVFVSQSKPFSEMEYQSLIRFAKARQAVPLLQPPARPNAKINHTQQLELLLRDADRPKYRFGRYTQPTWGSLPYYFEFIFKGLREEQILSALEQLADRIETKWSRPVSRTRLTELRYSLHANFIKDAEGFPLPSQVQRTDTSMQYYLFPLV